MAGRARHSGSAARPWGPEGAEGTGGIWRAEGIRGAGEVQGGAEGSGGCHSPPHSHHSQRASVPLSVLLERVVGESLAHWHCPFYLPKGRFVVVWGVVCLSETKDRSG